MSGLFLLFLIYWLVKFKKGKFSKFIKNYEMSSFGLIRVSISYM